MFSVQLFQELFEHLLIHCKDHQVELQNQSHNSVVEALLRVMHEFLLFKAKQQEQSHEQLAQVAEKTASVSMFYVASATGGFDSKPGGTLGDTVQSDTLQKRPFDGVGQRAPGAVAALAEQDGAAGPALNQRRNSNPDVNEIIVKIEMKKFQNLIENRIKHKNNLLQADMKRVYPLTKKGQAGGLTLYDQHLSQQQSPKRRRLKSQTATDEQQQQLAQTGGRQPTEGDQPGSPKRATKAPLGGATTN